jgi:hypothetical protein
LNASDISFPIEIPASFLDVTTYQITLTLKNFLYGQTTSSVSVVISNSVSKPIVTVLGGKSISTVSSAAITQYGTADLPSCAVATRLSYKWIVLSSTSHVEITSTSNNPKLLSLPSYTLDVGLEYNAILTVTSFVRNSTAGVSSASLTIYVESGNVVAVISGGSLRSAAIANALVVDGSESYDDDYSGITDLNFTWSCTISSLNDDYGAECGLFTNNATEVSTPTLVVEPNRMKPNSTYQFQLNVLSNDGREGIATTSIISSTAEVDLIITTSLSYANVLRKLSIVAVVFSNTDIRANWQTLFENNAVSVNPLTNEVQEFAAYEVLSGIDYSYTLPGNSLIEGRTYTFQLTACESSNPSNCVFSSIDIGLRAPPFNGELLITPDEGEALTTSFKYNSYGWLSDDEDAYPFLYDFKYSQANTLSNLTIATRSSKTYTSSILPAGLESSDFYILVTGTVTDNFDLSANASASVLVTTANNISASNLAAGIGTSYAASGDEAVNAVASTLNVQNCSAVPNCSSLSRRPCLELPNTCGSCFEGFIGIVGPSNKRCVNSSEPLGNVGEGCMADMDCLYDYCFNGTCAIPSLQCPSSLEDSVCSGNGLCYYFDSAGSLLSNCTIFDVRCTASCSCFDGFGGRDCSLTVDEVRELDESRGQLCSSLLSTIENSDASSQLLDSVVSALQQSFDPSQVS